MKKSWKIPKITFLLRFGSNLVYISFLVNREHLDGFQVDNGQFREVLLLMWNQKTMKNSKIHISYPIGLKFCLY